MGMGSAVIRPMLDDGGRKDAWHTPGRVVGSGKPNRPHPMQYLDADYGRH